MVQHCQQRIVFLGRADSDAQAEEILADPDCTFAYYYRYIRGVRQIEEFREHQGKPLPELNALLEGEVALEESVYLTIHRVPDA